MASLCLRLVLYTVAGVSAQTLSVFQPESVKVLEGSTVTLECSYLSKQKNVIGHYTWYYSRDPSSPRTEVSNKTDRYSGRFFQTSQTTFFAERKADITIHDIRHYDAGMYFCQVDIFIVGSGRGNGTFLEVIQGAPTTPNQEGDQATVEVQLPMSFVLQMGRTVVVLLVFGIIVLLIARYYGKKDPRKLSAIQVATNDYIE